MILISYRLIKRWNYFCVALPWMHSLVSRCDSLFSDGFETELNLSSLFLKAFVDPAWIMSKGKLFQSGTIRFVRKFSLEEQC